MQCQNIVFDRHLIEEDGEDALLHLAGVFGTQYDHLFLREVDRDGGGGRHAGGEAICGEGAGIVDDIVRVETLELFCRRADQHVAHEEGMVGTGADNAHADAVALVPAREAVDDIDAVAGVEIVDSALAVNTPDLRSSSVSAT